MLNLSPFCNKLLLHCYKMIYILWNFKKENVHFFQSWNPLPSLPFWTASALKLWVLTLIVYIFDPLKAKAQGEKIPQTQHDLDRFKNKGLRANTVLGPKLCMFDPYFLLLVSDKQILTTQILSTNYTNKPASLPLS